MKANDLIQTLIEQTRQIMNQAEKLRNLDLNAVTWKNDPTSWSILECLEHLNLYGDYYLQEMENAIKNSITKSEETFKSGLLGNYFSQSMLPKEKLNKMKTFKDKNPLNAKLDWNVLDRFIDQQMQLIQLLNAAQKVSLNKVKIKVSIAKFIKIKLGDTFQFVVNHNIRHFQQIDRIQKQKQD